MQRHETEDECGTGGHGASVREQGACGQAGRDERGKSWDERDELSRRGSSGGHAEGGKKASGASKETR